MIKPLTCPVCDKPLPPQVTRECGFFPFCSSRCKSIDLFRWTDGKYAIVEDLAQRPDLLQEILEEDLLAQNEPGDDPCFEEQ